MALCCLGFAAVAFGLAALRVVGSPILLMAIVCPVAMVLILWWHRQQTGEPPEGPAPVGGLAAPDSQSSPDEVEGAGQAVRS
jgi:hypothetical protein